MTPDKPPDTHVAIAALFASMVSAASANADALFNHVRAELRRAIELNMLEQQRGEPITQLPEDDDEEAELRRAIEFNRMEAEAEGHLPRSG